MSELSDPVTTVLDGLTIPPERDLPRQAMKAQRGALLAAIADGAVPKQASLAERIQLRLRTILGLFVMSAMLFMLAVTCTMVATGTGATKKVVELTAATSAVTAAALAAPPALQGGGTRSLLRMAGPPSALTSG
jgi:hypothetical protein